MTAKSDEGAVVRAANELYWESDSSVNQIAERLDISKGTLYGLIRPLPSEVLCPQCQEEMVYPNRTALEKGFLVCPGCAFEEEESVVREMVAGGVEVIALNVGDDAGGEPGAFPTRVVAGVALLSLAAGLIIARSIRSS